MYYHLSFSQSPCPHRLGTRPVPNPPDYEATVESPDVAWIAIASEDGTEKGQ